MTIPGFRFFRLLVPMAAVSLAGCTTYCCQPPCPPGSGPLIARSTPWFHFHPVTPPPPCSTVVPVVPLESPLPKGPVAPPAANIAPGPSSAEPPVVPPGGSVVPAWGPASGPDVRLSPPEFTPPEVPPSSIRSKAPESPEPPPSSSQKPSEEPAVTPTMPVGIPGFTPVKDGVSSGYRPLLEGLDWLKDNKYRAVLFLRQPGEEDSSDRSNYEKRGLKYLTLEVSPKNLTAEVVAKFNRLVGDPENRPLFVYDASKGMLTGPLWYLHFRTAENLSDEVAQQGHPSRSETRQRPAAGDVAGDSELPGRSSLSSYLDKEISLSPCLRCVPFGYGIVLPKRFLPAVHVSPSFGLSGKSASGRPAPCRVWNQTRAV